MIGYKMGFSLTMFTLQPRYEWKNYMVVNMATIFARRVLWRSSFLGNLKPLDHKFGLWRTPT